MKLIRGLHNLTRPLPASAVTIGNFDGVHHGHQVLLHHLIAKSEELEVPSTLVTDGAHGQSFSWVYSPSSPTSGCPAVADAEWRAFRIDMIRAGIEQQHGFGPFQVGLSSGSLSLSLEEHHKCLA